MRGKVKVSRVSRKSLRKSRNRRLGRKSLRKSRNRRLGRKSLRKSRNRRLGRKSTRNTRMRGGMNYEMPLWKDTCIFDIILTRTNISRSSQTWKSWGFGIHVLSGGETIATITDQTLWEELPIPIIEDGAEAIVTMVNGTLLPLLPHSGGTQAAVIQMLEQQKIVLGLLYGHPESTRLCGYYLDNPNNDSKTLENRLQLSPSVLHNDRIIINKNIDNDKSLLLTNWDEVINFITNFTKNTDVISNILVWITIIKIYGIKIISIGTII